jgi:hypothetical protein
MTTPQDGRSGREPRTARSALTFRAVLASFGLVTCTVLAVVAATLDRPVIALALVVLAVVAVVDLNVLRLRRRAERSGPTGP